MTPTTIRNNLERQGRLSRLCYFAIDVGNTQTVLGAYRREDRVTTPQHMWRIATDKHDAADDLRIKLMSLLAAEGIAPEDVDAAALSSVVPLLARAWERALLECAGVEARMCTAAVASEAGLFEADYPNPREIGADRVADAVAARKIYGAPVIVVDFGTATNIEVVDEGVASSAASSRRVWRRARARCSPTPRALRPPSSRLRPLLWARRPKRPSSRASSSARRAGWTAIERVFEQIGCRCPVVATGGLAALVGAHARTVTDVLPELTLEGLRLLAAAEGDLDA